MKKTDRANILKRSGCIRSAAAVAMAAILVSSGTAGLYRTGLAAEDSSVPVYVPGTGGETEMTVGNITLDGSGDYGYAAWAQGYGQDVSLTVDGSILMNSSAETGWIVGAEAYSSAVSDSQSGTETPGSSSVTVNGGISMDLGSRGYAARAESHNGSKSAVTLNGDAAVKAKKQAVGVNSVAAESGNSEVYATGSINVESAADKAIGVIAEGSSEGSAKAVTAGDITAISSGNGAFGLWIRGQQGDSSIEHTGNISVSVDSDGFLREASGVMAGYLYDMYDGNNGSVKVTGDIRAEARGNDADAYGVNVHCDRASNYNVEVKGNIESQSENSRSYGAFLYAWADNVLNAKIDGNITAVGSEEYGSYGINTFSRSNSTVTADVNGDVKAATGIYLGSSEENGYTDVCVNGTVEGTENAVMIGTIGSESEDFSEKTKLTVWKLVPDSAGAVAVVNAMSDRVDEYGFPIYETKEIEEFEKEILYIIKSEDGEGCTISVLKEDGTPLEESHEYGVAREGEKIKIQVTPEEGRVILGVFNNDGESETEILPDENGEYYYEVPRGGGVNIYAKTAAEEKGEVPDNGGSGEKTPAAEEPAGGSEKSPATGDPAGAALPAMLMISAAGLFLLKSKRSGRC